MERFVVKKASETTLFRDRFLEMNLFGIKLIKYIHNSILKRILQHKYRAHFNIIMLKCASVHSTCKIYHVAQNSVEIVHCVVA